MKKYIASLFFCLFIISVKGGETKSFQVSILHLPVNLDTAYEISSIIVQNDLFILTSEKCRKIFYLKQGKGKKTDSLFIVHTINLNDCYFTDKMEIEGTVMYHNSILFVDEGSKRLYEYNPYDKIANKINLDNTTELFNYTDNEYGVEGIAANEQVEKNKLYILRERNEKTKKSEIYTYEFKNKDKTDMNERYELKFIKKNTIDIPDLNWRYSDIYFDAPSNKLFAIRIYYDKYNILENKYYIDAISLNEAGLIPASNLNPDNIKYIDVITSASIKSIKTLTDYLKEIVKANDKVLPYDNNIEGICKNGKNIYVVSDNNTGSKDCGKAQKKTLLIRIEIP